LVHGFQRVNIVRDITVLETFITVHIRKKCTHFLEELTVSVPIQQVKTLNRTSKKDNRHQDSE
jgi:hypothetical protein